MRRIRPSFPVWNVESCDKYFSVKAPTSLTIQESFWNAAVIEFKISTSTVSGGAPYLIHHVEWVSSHVKTALDVQFSSFISTDDAAEIGKSVYVRKFFIINLDWACVDIVISAIISIYSLLLVCQLQIILGEKLFGPQARLRITPIAWNTLVVFLAPMNPSRKFSELTALYPALVTCFLECIYRRLQSL